MTISKILEAEDIANAAIVAAKTGDDAGCAQMLATVPDTMLVAVLLVLAELAAKQI